MLTGDLLSCSFRPTALETSTVPGVWETRSQAACLLPRLAASSSMAPRDLELILLMPLVPKVESPPSKSLISLAFESRHRICFLDLVHGRFWKPSSLKTLETFSLKEKPRSVETCLPVFEKQT